jgi:16S rRNA (guanine966-N2)-methyltransferase
VGRLRIIAGDLRGRRISVPDRSTTRPTSDRAREALFDILGPAARGAKVLDAYAGTGALGLEALSRGAAAVLFVESDRVAARAIRDNAERLGVAGRCRTIAGDVLAVLARGVPGGPFDLVLADPPYAVADVGPFLRAAHAVLAPGGTVVVERDRAAAAETAGPLACARSETYGRCRLDFYVPVPREPGTTPG